MGCAFIFRLLLVAPFVWFVAIWKIGLADGMPSGIRINVLHLGWSLFVTVVVVVISLPVISKCVLSIVKRKHIFVVVGVVLVAVVVVTTTVTLNILAFARILFDISVCV